MNRRRPRPATLLLIDPSGVQPLTARTNRRWVRLLTTALAARLDRRLADGHAPESNRLLASRADLLVSPAMRGELAHDLANVLAQAVDCPPACGPQVRLNRRAIVDGEREMYELINALAVDAPAMARGAAMASSLLSDGTGPLFNRRRSAELRHALRDAVAHLDPTARLEPSF